MSLLHELGLESNFLIKKEERQQNTSHLEVERALNNYLSQSPIYKQHRRFGTYIPQNQQDSELNMNSWGSINSSGMRRRVSEICQPEPILKINSDHDTPHIYDNSFLPMPEAISPPLSVEPQQQTSGTMNLNCSEKENFNSYSFMGQITPMPFFNSIQNVECNQMIGMDKSEDLISMQDVRSNSPSTMIIVSPFITQFNHTPSPSFSTTASSLSVTGSCTPATSMTSMSRQSSVCGGLSELEDNVQCNSTSSFSTSKIQARHDHSWGSFQENFTSPIDDGSLLVRLNDLTQSPQSPVATYGCISVEKMQKSPSKQSSSSSLSSSSTRSLRRLQEQNNLAGFQPIKPKGLQKNSKSTSKASSLSQVKKSNVKAALSKPNYHRPKHDRVYCTLCSSHPKGFRGEHELRRHQDREHNSVVQKYICVEPTDGLDHPKPVFPLSQCKACSQQMKRYNAYYNAAAHLRRAHFNPKFKTRSKNKLDDNKRGGKGGGDWPSMKELRSWMKQLVEPHDLPVSNIIEDDSTVVTEDIGSKSHENLAHFQDFSMSQDTTDDKASNLFSPFSCDTNSTFNNSELGDINMNLGIIGADNFCMGRSFGNSLMEQQLPTLISDSLPIEQPLNYGDPFSRSFQNMLDPIQILPQNSS